MGLGGNEKLPPRRMKCPVLMMAATSEYVDAAAAVAAEEGEALMLVDIWREAEERVTLWGSAEGDKGGGQLSICCDQCNINIYWQIQLEDTIIDGGIVVEFK